MNGAIVRALCATNDDARILLSVRKHHHSLPAWLLTYTRFCGRDLFPRLHIPSPRSIAKRRGKRCRACRVVSATVHGLHEQPRCARQH